MATWRQGLDEVQRRIPGRARQKARGVALAGLGATRRLGATPRGIVSLDELLSAHLVYGIESSPTLVEENPTDGTIDWSPIRFPPRPVRSVFTMIDAPGNDGWRFDLNHAIAPDNRIVYEPNLPATDVPAMMRRLDPSPKRLDGTVAYLSNTWPTNYSHWLLLTLPLVDRYREHLGSEPDYWYVGEPPRAWQVESLEAAGVDPDRLLWESVTADRIVVCAVGRYGRGVDSRSLGYARSLLSRASSIGSRLVFLARGEATTRRFLNEAECFAAVEDLGFEFVSTSGMTLADEATEFQDTAVLLTCHGSASTNVAFAPSACVLVEMFPPELQSDSNSMFAELAAAGGGRHLALAGRPVSPGTKQIDADLDMDPAMLRPAIERLLSELTLG